MSDTKRPRGRPRESIDGGRMKRRDVWASDAEWAWIRARAAERGLSAGAWIRERVLRGARGDLRRE